MKLMTAREERLDCREKVLPIAVRATLRPSLSGSLLLGLALCGLGSAAWANAISDLGTIGGTNTYARGVNAVGDVLVGYSSPSGIAFRWTQADGMVDLGNLGGASAYAMGVNAAGNVVVGYSSTAGGATRAFRWTQAGGMDDIGVLTGGSYSQAYAVNAAGDVVVGYGDTTGGHTHAFRWTGGTMTDLGTLGGNDSYAQAVNAAGDVVVGYGSTTGGDTHAFRWAGGIMTDLGTLGGSISYANAVNAAGNVVVGESQVAGDTSCTAFRWTEADGMVSLGTLTGDSASYASGINAAGDVVVGYSSGSENRAFRWTETGGMQSVNDWLADHGVDVVGSTPSYAYGVSDDGNTVVGTLANGHVYLARVGPSAGMIDVAAFSEGLGRVANSGLLAINDANLVMNGLHSQPMRTLLAEGRTSAWLGGDIGRHDSRAYDTDQGMAEIGFGHRFNSTLQLNLSAGRTYSKASTGLGGRTRTQSSYVMPELIVSLPASVHATFSAYYGEGRSHIDRVYDNAGTLERSSAEPGLTSIGAKLRVDWLDAFKLGTTSVTPYASLSYMETRMDGYEERGVAFPVVWDKRTDKATTAHIGLDAVRSLTAATTLLGRVEVGHRFEDKGASTSGQIVGVSGFNFAGQDIKQNWLRLGAGVETKLGAGILGAMLNVTTQGEAPSYWLSASYRWVF